MSSIGGKKRESSSNDSSFSKKVGLFEATVVAINPDAEEYKEILGMELKEDSKALDYLGKSQDGNTNLRVDIWLEQVKTGDKFKATFFLEDKVKENKDQTKKQYINAVGTTSWADDPNNLPEWFSKREYRPAFIGEDDFYGFLKTWLGNLDYRDADTTLQVDWKKMMRGNLNDLKSQINGEWSTNVVALATIKTVIKDDEIKEYQNMYTKAFLPAFALRQFRLVDYKNDKVLDGLRSKKAKDLKPHEKFVVNVTGEYGSKDYFTLTDIKEYNADDNLVSSDAVLSDDGADY